MVRQRASLTRLPGSYLFSEIARRKQAFCARHPEAKLISLGIGDTVLPLGKACVDMLVQSARALGTAAGYVGYGEEQGLGELREKIATEVYHGAIDPDEIFISDGAKCDLGRLQLLFGPDVSIAIQDPSYPVYSEGSVLQGAKKVHFLPCTPATGFFPDLTALPSELDLLYVCNPNNPTGVAYTADEIELLIEEAQKRSAFILLDGAYAAYATNREAARSLFTLNKGKEVGIEVHSFSKTAGFSGLRLGWTVVPKALKFSDGSSVHRAWRRVYTTLFNGASILSQRAGLALFTEEGKKESEAMVATYLKHAHKLKKALVRAGYSVYGGDNAPYLWVNVGEGASWEAFDFFLEHKGLVVTPGVGYGRWGEGFIRISSFVSPRDIDEACARCLATPHFHVASAATR